MKSLAYRLETDELTSYRNPPAVHYETEAFSLVLTNGLLTIDMKAHFPEVAMARDVVESFLRAWEIHVALGKGPGELSFIFDHSEVIDRAPASQGGPQVIDVSEGIQIGATLGGKVHAIRAAYPDPPAHFQITPDVESLWQRYQNYKNGKEPLLSMAYFCLSVIEAKACTRSQAATQLLVGKKVLDTLGKLTSTVGDTLTARKLSRTIPPRPLTNKEVAWVEEVITTLIRRVGEIDQNNQLQQITILDLPPLED